MKKIFSRILAVGLLSAGIIGVSSCDYLDQKPENLKTTDMIWETRVEAEAYLSSNPQLSSSASFLRLNVLSSLN